MNNWVTHVKTWRVEGSTAIATRFTNTSATESEEVARAEFASSAQAREFIDNLIAAEGHGEHRWSVVQSVIGRPLEWLVQQDDEILAQYRRQFASDISGIIRHDPDYIDQLAQQWRAQQGVSA